MASNQASSSPVQEHGEELYGVSLSQKMSLISPGIFCSHQGQTEQLVLPGSKSHAWVDRCQAAELIHRHSLETNCYRFLSHILNLPSVLTDSQFVAISFLFRKNNSHLCFKSLLRLWLLFVVVTGNSPSSLFCYSLFSYSPCCVCMCVCVCFCFVLFSVILLFMDL